MLEGEARSGDVTLSYRVLGEGPRTLLLVMGLGGRGADWGTEVPAALAEDRRVVLFDNRGTGRSTKPSSSWTMEDMARDAVAVLDAVGAERADVMGISMGGMVSQVLALEHADRVDRTVLLSTYTGGPKVVPPTPEVSAVFTPPRGMPRDEIVRSRVALITAPGFAERFPDKLEELVRIATDEPTPTPTFAAQLQAVLGCDHADRLATLRGPVLIVHGDADPLIPFENARMLHEKLPQARLEVLPGAGHLPMWECPDALLGVVRPFFA